MARDTTPTRTVSFGTAGAGIATRATCTTCAAVPVVRPNGVRTLPARRPVTTLTAITGGPTRTGIATSPAHTARAAVIAIGAGRYRVRAS